MIFFRNPYKNNRMRALESVTIIKQKLTPEKFDIEYPFIQNDNSDKVISKINNNIIDEVSKLFRSQVLLPEEVDFNEIFGTYEIMLNNDDILSILFSMYTYVNKAAHGVTAYSSLTVNTKTGQLYSFNDLFNPKMNYIPIINEISKQYIKDNNIPLINEYNGITKDQQFYLTEDKLVIYYQPYEYTPGYYGIFKIEIPYDKIKNLITPLSPISKLMV
ncbi:DUF3298 domain-containing protein [Clostridium neuense]|uniref:DUF3298 domain-containing protein n=1 Tax=Clostridium neuense TaxID=1728934 RepID=A0ABW8TLQ2_9CLOT